MPRKYSERATTASTGTTAVADKPAAVKKPRVSVAKPATATTVADKPKARVTKAAPKPKVKVEKLDMSQVESTPRGFLKNLREGRIEWTHDILLTFFSGPTATLRLGRITDTDSQDVPETVWVQDYDGNSWELDTTATGKVDGAVKDAWYIDDPARVADGAPWEIGTLVDGYYQGKVFKGKEIVAVGYNAVDDETKKLAVRDKFTATVKLDSKTTVVIVDGSKSKLASITKIVD